MKLLIEIRQDNTENAKGYHRAGETVARCELDATHEEAWKVYRAAIQYMTAQGDIDNHWIASPAVSG